MKTGNNIRGFSLIELMIVVALVAFFLLMAAPSFRLYLENSKVRNVAESIEKGMQIAKFNAIKTNHLTEFVLTQAGGVNNGWIVREQVPSAIPANPATVTQVETFVWGAGGKNWVTVNTTAVDAQSGGANAVTFDGMGQLQATNTAWTGPVALANPIAQVSVTSSSGMTGTFPLRVQVGLSNVANPTNSTSTRVCRPDLLLTTDSRGC
ncbi:MAG: prepilin-type N-terminal cleavage/methylation domain-containing protein [Proteobacteria bacterium]|nr:prepilin-type N-terminal cleavage/methylation domain-containing protein [Pseudomonadota bacterium]